jgi:hypothetical protein
MDDLRTISENTFSVIFKNYILVLSLLGLILAFALYVYFFRHTIAEYFDSHQKKEIKPAVEPKQATPA